MARSLIAFDTDHIKQYVFGTNKLKEIRGASSWLDYLNRIVMTQLAESYDAVPIYANGGSGLFLVKTERANAFGRHVQRAYGEVTGGGASVTYVSQPLPEGITDVWEDDIADTLDLVQWRLQEEKQQPPAFIAFPSHPFMRPCSACGIEYADAGKESRKSIRDPGEEDELYCESCQNKRERDIAVKGFIERVEEGRGTPDDEYLWNKIISRLREMHYDLPPLTQRPRDFNVFRNFKGAKDYLGLIYADANNMGQTVGKQTTLCQKKAFATTIDDAIYEAVCRAIAKHLRIKDHLKPKEQLADDLKDPVFPFDILLLGGDDVLMVVPASVALDVALTLAEEFRGLTHEKHTLSAGVVLAPVKYPFGLLRQMAETTLKFAKKEGAKARALGQDDTRINFMIVTGGSSSDFKDIYNTVYHKKMENTSDEFYATLRPYTPDDLRLLLTTIRKGHQLNLGRTKLHQLREAVLQMNLTTAVVDGLAILSNWRDAQRSHVVRQVYAFGEHHQMPRVNPREPASGFPRVTFPWFADGRNDKGGSIYRTSLLDFVELYDFLSREGEDEHAEN